MLNFYQGEDLQHILHSIQDMFFFEKPSRENSAQDRKFFARYLAALTRCLARLAQDVLLNATSIARFTIDIVFNTQGILLKTSQ